MLLRDRRSRKRNTRVVGDDWDNEEDSDQELLKVNNDSDQVKSAPLRLKRYPVAAAKHRRRQRNSRYLGDEWDNDEDSDENQSSTVKSDRDREVCVPLGRKDCPIAVETGRMRKKNRRYFGDDWDTREQSDEYQEQQSCNQDTCTARFPKKRAVAHQIGRNAIARGKQPKKGPKFVPEIEEYDNENADPNQPGPSVWRRVRRRPVLTSSDSDQEWVPPEESHGETVDTSDYDESSLQCSPVGGALLPQESAREHNNCKVALGEAVDVEYLDHGGRSLRCELCKAMLYGSEKVKRDGKITGGSLCCHNGKAASLETHFPEVPEPLQSLFNDYTSPAGKLFHNKVRFINSALQMASSTANIKHKKGPSMMVAEGNIYHLLNPIETSGDPQYVQLYMIDDQEKELAERLKRMKENADESSHCQRSRTEDARLHTMLGEIQAMVHEVNPYPKVFQSVRERLADHDESDVVEFEFEFIENDTKVYNKPQASELMVVVDDKERSGEKRGLRLQARNRVNCKKAVTIWDRNPSYEPLHFVMLYPHGTEGWHSEMGLTIQQYATYWLHDRPNDVHANFTKAGRLFQEWILDTYVKMERRRINYFKSAQFNRRMRRSALRALKKAVRKGCCKGSEAGTEAMEVPSTHIGSHAYFRKKRFDAFALARAFGNPSLFITMTCNACWPEIQRELLPGQAVEDRPDIVSRVFHIKMQQLKDEIVNERVFGEVEAYTHRVEFQKRGLPHVHVLVWLKDKALTSTGPGIDSVSRACIPDPIMDPRGYDLVTKHMMHGPCDSRCLKDGTCREHYPMEFREQMTAPNNSAGGGYPFYRRPNDGRRVVKHGVRLDNRHVVPYNMYLLKRYNCHLNVMVSSGIEAIKYMFKYVYKEASRGNLGMKEKQKKDGDTTETVENFFDGLCVGSAEACWRLFGFELAGSSPNVLNLQLHTPDNQNVLFEESEDLKDVVEDARLKETMLTAWFKFNAKAKEEYEAAVAQGRHVQRPLALTTCYADIAGIACWDAVPRRWKLRKSSVVCVGRLPFVQPRDRERWCLKQLLCAIPGATSWDDLKRVSKDGKSVVCATFEEACRERGMMEEDAMWYDGMDEAVKEGMPCQLRVLFVEMLTFCDITDRGQFWNRYKHALSEDYLHEADKRLGEDPEDPCKDSVAEDEHGRWSWRAVLDLQELLEEQNKTLESCDIPRPPQDLSATEVEKEVRSYFRFSYEDIEGNVARLNEQQREAYDRIMEAVEGTRSGQYSGPTVFFLDGVGGSGKTFLYKTLLMKVRKPTEEEAERCERPVALAMASNGLPAQLLPNGTTVHKRFRVPVTDDFEGRQLICGVQRQSGEAEVLRKARLIVWDEAPAMNKWHLEAVDRLLRDIMRAPDKPMGGKVVVLGGDFRQCGPVLKNSKGMGRRAAEVNASLSHWDHWSDVYVLRLHINMRVQNCVRPDRQERLEEWSRWLKSLGDGEVPLDKHGRLEVPASVAFVSDEQDPEKREDDFFKHMYSDLKNKRGDERDAVLKETAVLVPKNDTADRVNDRLLDTLLDGEEHLYVAVNTVPDKAQQRDDPYPEEYLASIKESGLPAHVIRLKVGAPIIALRNLTKGVSNGTRMVVTKLLQHSIRARVLHGPSAGREIPIGRAKLDQNMGSFQLQRCQLPIRVAFAITINKAQGLTLRRVGVYLEEDVFSHGQLYVAFSRCGDNENLWVFGPQPDEEGRMWIKNVVYKEVLIDT